MRKYLFFASGVISTILIFKLLFKKPPSDSDVPPLEDPDKPLPPPLEDPDKPLPPPVSSPDLSSSDEKIMEMTSRSGHTIKTKYKRRNPKLSNMKKDELIDECVQRNIACVGTVRVLRERLRVAREEERA
tara:strand:+ start:684 stop:1073 length:390 start_codon:yes stop_codon:yes gene_type:complete